MKAAPIDPNDPGQGRKDLTLLRRMLADYDASKVDATLSLKETMGGHNYMWVGSSAAEIIMMSVLASRLTEVRSVLDLPCGHEPKEILFDLVREGDRWLVDDVQSTTKGKRWTMSKALTGAPDAFPDEPATPDPGAGAE